MSTDNGAIAHPDPRPRVVEDAAKVMVEGWRCSACRRPYAVTVARCPACFAPVEPARFGPAGRVWSNTLLHISLGGRPTPSCLAYIDLDDGPRVLARVAPTPGRRLTAGTPITLAPATDESGDLFATVAS